MLLSLTAPSFFCVFVSLKTHMTVIEGFIFHKYGISLMSTRMLGQISYFLYGLFVSHSEARLRANTIYR